MTLLNTYVVYKREKTAALLSEACSRVELKVLRRIKSQKHWRHQQTWKKTMTAILAVVSFPPVFHRRTPCPSLKRTGHACGEAELRRPGSPGYRYLQWALATSSTECPLFPLVCLNISQTRSDATLGNVKQRWWPRLSSQMAWAQPPCALTGFFDIGWVTSAPSFPVCKMEVLMAFSIQGCEGKMRKSMLGWSPCLKTYQSLSLLII